MNTDDIELLPKLLDQAKQKYKTAGAQAFLSKIQRLQKSVCYAHTSKSFTAGHVSDQRSEGAFSGIKANGKLKELLKKATYKESIERLSQFSRRQDIKTLGELQCCLEGRFKVGERCRTNWNNSKLLALGLAYVERIGDSRFKVKEREDSPKFCIVNTNDTVMWQGVKKALLLVHAPTITVHGRNAPAPQLHFNAPA